MDRWPDGRVVLPSALRLLSYLPWKGLAAGAVRRKIRRMANAVTLPEHPWPLATVTGVTRPEESIGP